MSILHLLINFILRREKYNIYITLSLVDNHKQIDMISKYCQYRTNYGIMEHQKRVIVFVNYAW